MKKVLYNIWNFIVLIFICIAFVIGFILVSIVSVVNWLYMNIFKKKKELIPISKWLDNIDKPDTWD